MSSALGTALAEALRPLLRDVVREVIEETSAAPAPALLDDAACARELDVSVATLRRMLPDGLPHVLVGDHRRYRLPDVLDFLEQRSRQRRETKP